MNTEETVKPKKKHSKKRKQENQDSQLSIPMDSLMGIISPDGSTGEPNKKRASTGKSEQKKKRQKKTEADAEANIDANNATSAEATKKKGRKKSEELMILDPATGQMVPAPPKPKKPSKRREKDPNAVKSSRGRKLKNADNSESLKNADNSQSQGQPGTVPIGINTIVDQSSSFMTSTFQRNQTIAESKKNTRKMKAGAPTIITPTIPTISPSMLGSPRAFIPGASSYPFYNSKLPMPPNTMTSIDGQPRTPTSGNSASGFGYPTMISPKNVTSPSSGKKIVISNVNSTGGAGAFNVIQPLQGIASGYINQQFYGHFPASAVSTGNSTPSGAPIIGYPTIQAPYQFVPNATSQPSQSKTTSNSVSSSTTPSRATPPNVVFVNMNKNSRPIYTGTPNQTTRAQPVQQFYTPGMSTTTQMYSTAPYTAFMPFPNVKNPTQQGTKKVGTPAPQDPQSPTRTAKSKNSNNVTTIIGNKQQPQPTQITQPKGSSATTSNVTHMIVKTPMSFNQISSTSPINVSRDI